MNKIVTRTKQNYSQALAWYKKAADKGEVAAQVSLGTIYYQGTGAAQDYHQAAKLYLKADNQGNATAQYNLGVNY